MRLPNQIPPMPAPTQQAKQPAKHMELIDGELKIVERRLGILYARIHLGKGKYKFVSLGTRSWNEAPELARAEYYRIKTKLEIGVAVKRYTFEACWTEFEDAIKDEYTLGHRSKPTYDSICNSGKHLLPFFGKDTIDKIDGARWNGFVLWRRKKAQEASKDVAAKTLNTHLVHLKQCLKWAQLHKRVVIGELDFKRVKQGDTRRPAFELQDYIKLKKWMFKWAWKKPGDRTAIDRQRMRYMVMVLAETGMRVGELTQLKWRDVGLFKDDKGRDNVRFTIREGKTVEHTGVRDVIGTVNVAKYVFEWAAWNKRRKDNDYVFPNHDGKELTGHPDSFRRMLKTAGMRVTADDIPYTLYSLRHTYATLYLKHSPNPDVFLLAKNMGTDVSQIMKHYGQVKAMDKATHLGETGAFEMPKQKTVIEPPPMDDEDE